MTFAWGLLIAALFLVLMLESWVRFRRLRLAPLRLRLWHACFLLSREAVEAITEIHQRVERAGGRSFDDLFELYASASGKSKAEIEALFGFQMSWWKLTTSRLVLQNILQWHMGLVPKPDQRLRTVSIASDGTRATDSGLACETAENGLKRVVLTGGSVAYGYGATRDAHTVASRLEYYLNSADPNGGRRWQVVNYAFPAGNSFQELISVLQKVDFTNQPPAYVVSLTGCNDVDQQFSSARPNISALSQGYTNALQSVGPMGLILRRSLRRHLLCVGALRRFVAAYEQWSGDHGQGGRQAGAEKGKPFDEIDNPNIYPLW
ncbi:MAG: hypothetical protein EPO61_01240 [Nitrospirae bacterium]|nr:MAG: hypothetical protein EPO61_01240 [Nitrospirota bacterium]